MQSDGEEGVVVDLAIKTIEMLAALRPAAGKAATDESYRDLDSAISASDAIMLLQ